MSELYFAHPESRYFSLGKTDRDQFAAKANARGWAWQKSSDHRHHQPDGSVPWDRAIIPLRDDPYLLRCLLMAFVIWNISNRAFPNTGFSFSSAMISRRFFGSCNLCFLM